MHQCLLKYQKYIIDKGVIFLLLKKINYRRDQGNKTYQFIKLISHYQGVKYIEESIFYIKLLSLKLNTIEFYIKGL